MRKNRRKVGRTSRGAIRRCLWLWVVQEARRVPKVPGVDHVLGAHKWVPVGVEGLG